MYRFRVVAAALVVLGIALSACTSGNSSSESSASPEASASGTAEAVSPMASASATSGAESSPASNAGTPVSYTDLDGTFGEKQISELAALGVFGTPSGTFNPTGTITRGDFVKWLVLANNAIFADNPGKQIRPS